MPKRPEAANSSAGDRTCLVADVGGTNTRFALVAQGAGTRHLESFDNDRYASFDAVLAAYLGRRALPALHGCCVAVAGPVAAARARLTNRDWDFDTARIAAALPSGNRCPVHLINDLAALGHALESLRPGQLSEIRPAGTGGPAVNAQALVAGLGTGFNVCLVAPGSGDPVVVEAELGHASLPYRVHAALAAHVGADAAAGFSDNEDLFSGPGLARLFRALARNRTRTGPEILRSYATRDCAESVASVELLARLLGLFTRDLVFQYLPFGGIHFAGGAARGILGSDARARFLEGFRTPGRFETQVAQVPLRLITDDAAALSGAARVAGIAPAPQ